MSRGKIGLAAHISVRLLRPVVEQVERMLAEMRVSPRVLELLRLAMEVVLIGRCVPAESVLQRDVLANSLE